MRLVEICCDSLVSVKNAIAGGADRIELCSALNIGGLTPDDQLLKESLLISDIPIYILIRPREGNFIYNDKELTEINESILKAKSFGAAGIVLGAITPERKIAWDAIEKMLGHANQLQVTFHRAIDLVDKNEETLKQLFDLGISRILTSGSVSNSENEWQSAANAKGLDLLLRIKNRPNILACGGIRPQNLKSLIALSDLTEIHSAARKTNFVEQEIVKELKAKWK